MPYHVILTHNPQDFFAGVEPDELTLEFYPESDDDWANILRLIDDDWANILRLVDGGYVAIVTTMEGGD